MPDEVLLTLPYLAPMKTPSAKTSSTRIAIAAKPDFDIIPP
jgi:hypothetical protein